MDERTRKCVALATKWYSKNKLAHATRVANYAMEAAEDLGFDDDVIEEIYRISILHDILEDTECDKNTVMGLLKYTAPMGALERLTHRPEESYEEYILRLSEPPKTEDESSMWARTYALIIKRADMKDHLMLEETLSDKLKAKYFPVIKHIL